MITSGGSPFRWEGENRPVEGDVGRIMRRASSAALALAVGLGALSGGQAIAGQSGRVIHVDRSATTQPGVCGDVANPCNTIQAGINNARAGDTVQVVVGTYREQVTIDNDKNGLTLFSANPDTPLGRLLLELGYYSPVRRLLPYGATIQAPSTTLTGPKAIVHIKGATGVTITGFTISGPGPGACGSLAAGIYVSTGGSATINDNHITSIRDNPVSGCQNGHGILVGGTGLSAPGVMTTGSATIRHNMIADYQKHGIVVERVGSSADIRGNTVTGQGPTSVIVQHGIRIADGAKGTIAYNSVSGNFFTVSAAESSGLKARETAAGVKILMNHSHGNQIGISLEQTSNNDVGWNTSRLPFVLPPGFTLPPLYGVTPIPMMSAPDDLGILLLGSATTRNLVHDNWIVGARVGVVVADSSNQNTLRGNEIRNSSSNNDAVDQTSGTGTAGTANTWSGNICAMSMPVGLC